MKKPTPSSPNNKFTKSEEKAFAPGEELSTPKQREEQAASGDFLDEKEKKYPYKIHGRISCNLLKAAIVRSAQNNEPEINKKARDLFDDNC